MTRLYADGIKELARRAADGRPLADPDRSAYRKNPMCGDEVTVSVRLASGGEVEVGYRARGCLLCLAACERMAELAQTRRTSFKLAPLVAAANLMFESSVPPQLEVFAPVAAHRSRHKCVLLPFEALAEILGSEP